MTDKSFLSAFFPKICSGPSVLLPLPIPDDEDPPPPPTPPPPTPWDLFKFVYLGISPPLFLLHWTTTTPMTSGHLTSIQLSSTRLAFTDVFLLHCCLYLRIVPEFGSHGLEVHGMFDDLPVGRELLDVDRK